MIEKTLEQKIEIFDSLDSFDRNQVFLEIQLLNQNSREGWRIYKKAQEKGLV